MDKPTRVLSTHNDFLACCKLNLCISINLIGWRGNKHSLHRLPNVVGASNDSGFAAAPVDLFVYNVNSDVSENEIVDHMKATKGLHIANCSQASHPEARTKSFKITVNASDYDKAMHSDTWPYRVRVRPFKHFKHKRQEGGTFNAVSSESNMQSGSTTTTT